jgi:hypothetical protein
MTSFHFCLTFGVIYYSHRIALNNLDKAIRFLATNGVCGFIVNGPLCSKGCCSLVDKHLKNQPSEEAQSFDFPPVNRNPDEPLGKQPTFETGRVE